MSGDISYARSLTQRQQRVRIDLVGISVPKPMKDGTLSSSQDSVLITSENGFSCIAVADGLGSRSKSAQGSQLATRAALEVLTDYLGDPPTEGIESTMLPNEILGRWRRLLPSNEMEDFSTTLLFSAYAGTRLIVGGIGDGLAHVWAGSSMTKSVILGRSTFGNITHSLTSRNASAEFRTSEFTIADENLPICVLLASDGISDDLEPSRFDELAPTLARGVQLNGPDATLGELRNWLLNWPTAGHQDDKSLAAMLIWAEDDTDG